MAADSVSSALVCLEITFMGSLFSNSCQSALTGWIGFVCATGYHTLVLTDISCYQSARLSEFRKVQKHRLPNALALVPINISRSLRDVRNTDASLRNPG